MRYPLSASPYRVRRVLFATDCPRDYEGELQIIFDVCQTNGAKLRILHVYKPDEMSCFVGSSTQPDALLTLRQMEERATGLGICCSTRLELGVPSERIVKSIEVDRIDLTILGTRESRGKRHAASGDTAQEVMRESNCPVMTIGAVAAASTRRSGGPVVFATDFHPVTGRALPVAGSYCSSTNLRLHCLHVVPRTLQPLRGSAMLSHFLSGALKQMVAANAIPIEKPVCSVTFGSEISHAVVEYVRQVRASLIVLGLRRHGTTFPNDPLPIVFRILCEAPCPVMTVPCDLVTETEFTNRSMPARSA